jgi:hypothetical protein
MTTECNRKSLVFKPLGRREILGRFDGGTITSEAGGLLLREVERATGIIRKFSACFVDHRDPELIEHSVYDLVAQRVYGLCQGYEDLNDHDDLRRDPLLALLVGKADVEGQKRLRERDRGKALAGKSTLNRLELTPGTATRAARYKKIVADLPAMESFFVEAFLESQQTPPEEIILDLDATDDPIHGNQEGRFYHGYYEEYCYLPLYIFCGEHLLAAKLRMSNIDGAEGALEEVQRIVGMVRQRWPNVKITVRGDSGFCREAIMAWCEDAKVNFLFGLPKNERLLKEIEEAMKEAARRYSEEQKAVRVFTEFFYQTRESWSRSRRVIAKAEHLEKGANPRLIVTNLSGDARALYEETYCARGEMENRIKEQQLYLFADRTSAETMRANQLRLWFSSAAYVLLHALRRLALKETDMARAQCQTIRLKLLKIGAQIRVSVRKIWVSLAGGCPYQEIFIRAYENLLAATPLRC